MCGMQFNMLLGQNSRQESECGGVFKLPGFLNQEIVGGGGGESGL